MRDFESEFDKLCEKKRIEKERKKQLFDKNVEPHLVHMDDDGNIIKGKPKKPIRNESRFIEYAIIILLLFYIFYQVYGFIVYLMSY